TVELPLTKLGVDRGVLHRTLGPRASGTIDGNTLRMTLAPRAAAIFLVGVAPAAFDLPLWSMLVVALALVAITATALTLRRRSPPRQHAAIQREERSGIVALRSDVALETVARERKPRCAGRKSRIR